MIHFLKEHFFNYWLAGVSIFLRCFSKPTSFFDTILIKQDGLGDFVLASEAIRAILSANPSAKVALLTSPALGEIAALEFPTLALIDISDQAARSSRSATINAAANLRRLSHLRCRQLISLQFLTPPSIAASLAVIHAEQKLSMAVERYDRPKSLLFRLMGWQPCTVFSDPLKGIASEHSRILEMHARLLHFLSIEKTAAELRPRLLNLSAREDQTLIVSAMAGVGPESIRNLSLDHVRGAVHWATQHGLAVRFLGIPSQKSALITLAVECGVKDPEAVVLSSLSIREFLQTIANAGFVLSADTSTVHIAAALDKRLVVLFPGANFGWFGPWRHSFRQIWLSYDPGCFGCDRKCIHPEVYCITKISGKEVARHFQQLLLN